MGVGSGDPRRWGKLAAMATADAEQSLQTEYWNGPAGERWARFQEKLDASMASIAEVLLTAVAPRPTDRVLDIGCGAGATTRLLAAKASSALGVDVSRPMLEVARRLGGNYLEADAAAYPFEPVFDCVVSRFGVMFFSDPVAAFTNIRRAFAPDARMTFVCWRTTEENTWATLPLRAAGDLVPRPTASDPHAPGPFAFADPKRVASILSSAGYRDVSVEPRDTTMHLGATLEDATEQTMSMGPLARALADLSEDVRPKIRDRVQSALRESGTSLPAAIWLVRASG